MNQNRQWFNQLELGKISAEHEVLKGFIEVEDKGEEESLEARSDGQQKQLKRKWETKNVPPAGFTVSLNSLKMATGQLS